MTLRGFAVPSQHPFVSASGTRRWRKRLWSCWLALMEGATLAAMSGVAPNHMKRRCSICADPLRARWVAEQHLAGESRTSMERLSMKDDSVPGMKRETIGKHLDVCLVNDFQPRPKNEKTSMVGQYSAKLAAKHPEVVSHEDVATLVQQEVVKKLNDGSARVTVQHGLQAQQLLDRREERKQDRALAVTLARLLFTSPPPAEVVEPRLVGEGTGETTNIIEGVAVEVG